MTCDVTDAESTRSILTKLLESGPIQILVNNAGIHNDAAMAGMTAHQWTGVIAVSLHGFFNVTQPLLMPMIGTRWGRIITVSSVSGIVGRRGQTNYCRRESRPARSHQIPRDGSRLSRHHGQCCGAGHYRVPNGAGCLST